MGQGVEPLGEAGAETPVRIVRAGTPFVMVSELEGSDEWVPGRDSPGEWSQGRDSPSSLVLRGANSP